MLESLQTRHDFWREKINKNQDRDTRDDQALRELGWRVLTVWECAHGQEERHREDQTTEGSVSDDWLMVSDHPDWEPVPWPRDAVVRGEVKWMAGEL